MSWLSTRSAAAYLDVGEARFLALVRSGRLPPPQYLGDRSPRWSSEALDRAMNPETPSNATAEAFHGLVKKIEEKGGSRRSAGPQ